MANALEVSEPSLPRRRQRPACYESESVTPEFVDNAQDNFRQIYFNAIDQPWYKIYDQVEQMLVNAVNGNNNNNSNTMFIQGNHIPYRNRCGPCC